MMSVPAVKCNSNTFEALPVESVAHLNGDKHRQSHGHGRSSLKELAVNAGKVLILLVALHEVRLYTREARLLIVLSQSVCKRQHGRGTNNYQLVVGDTRASLIVEEPPGSTTNSGSTNVSC